MKKFSRLAISLVLLASFSVPFLAGAADFFSCPLGQVSNANGTSCIPAPGAGSVNDTYLRFYYDLVLTIVNSYFVPILIAIAFIVFLWGVYKYFIYGAENESEKAEGRKFVMWSVIGLVIITSVWGLVNMVKDTIIPTSAKDTRPNYPTL